MSLVELSSRLENYEFEFGQIGHPCLTTKMRFGRSGKIEGYAHPNESAWKISENGIAILNENGAVMWRSVNIDEDKNGILTVVFEHPASTETKFALKQRCKVDSNPITDVVMPAGLSDEYYLFPSDLEVTPTHLSNVLMVGSCLTALYVEEFRKIHPEIHFDYIPYNYVSQLPDAPPSPVQDYNFQYVQIPLRTVLTDRIVWAMQLNDHQFIQEILKDAFGIIDMMLDAAMIYNKNHGLLTFVTNFIVPQKNAVTSLHGCGTLNDLCLIVRRLNEHLATKVSEYKNAYLLDVDAVASSIGKRYILDDMVYFYSHGAVTYQDWDDFGSIVRNEPIPALESVYPIRQKDFILCAFRQALTAYRTLRQTDQVKAVIFDLDNTLWRGQIAEHYRPETRPWPRTDGWPLGIWEAIHHLRARGILVAICSKNDFDYVRAHWADVVEPGFISLDDFASLKINWVPKSQNISEICKDFNIKPKNVVFVDDNPVERAAVKTAFPEIRVTGGNPYLTRRILLWSAETQIARMTEESGRREEMIRNQMEREETRASMNREEFFSSLHCKVAFTEIKDSGQAEFNRALELTNKTNQFNTTGKRWSFEELVDFLKNGGKLISFKVKDKFSNYGTVGVVYVMGNEIIQFVMSCRVLGLGIEKFVLSDVVDFIKKENHEYIFAIIKENEYNTPCRKIYKDSGFKECSRSDQEIKFLFNVKDNIVCGDHIMKVDSFD